MVFLLLRNKEVDNARIIVVCIRLEPKHITT